MIVWGIVIGILGIYIGFGFHAILTSSKVGELYSEIDKLKLKSKSDEEAIRVLRENQKYTTYDSNGNINYYNK